MENNEIIMNEEVIDKVGETAVNNSGKLLKVAGGIAIVVTVGGLAYKFIVKPIVAKIKAKKELADQIRQLTDNFEETDEEVE